ncbi:MAG: hypothetical protein Q8Q18_02785 [bacterium]|nr:hypothetical protein [bacterium]
MQSHEAKAALTATGIALLVLLIATRSSMLVGKSLVDEQVFIETPSDTQVLSLLSAAAQNTLTNTADDKVLAGIALVSGPRTSNELPHLEYDGMLVWWIGLILVLALGYHQHTFALKNYPQFPKPQRKE